MDLLLKNLEVSPPIVSGMEISMVKGGNMHCIILF